MEDLLRDTIWQFILGLSTIIVAIIIFFLQRRKKSLAYDVIANTSLLALDEEIKGKIQILYDGTSVQKVHLLILHIMNDGNVPIIKSDFESPLTFEFGENTRILSAELIKTEPANLKPEFWGSPSESNISLEPLLLNSKDSIQLKLLLAQFEGIKEVGARINGVREVKDFRIRKKVLAGFGFAYGLIILIAALVLFTWSFPFLRSSTEINDTTFNSNGFTLGFFYGLVSSVIIGFVWGSIQNNLARRRGPDSPKSNQKA
jgi:hypothetical protein